MLEHRAEVRCPSADAVDVMLGGEERTAGYDPIYKRAMKKIIFNGQMWNKLFLIVIYHSSLIKAAVNAARVCNLCNDVKETLNFFFFQ